MEQGSIVTTRKRGYLVIFNEVRERKKNNGVYVMYIYDIYVYVDVCRNDLFYLTTHSTHFIYGYMASDIW